MGTRDGARWWAFLALFAALEAALLVPLWSAPWLPWVDWPEHLAVLAIGARLAAGSAADQALYTTDLFPNTNVAFFAIAGPLTSTFGPDVAGRIALSIYVLALAPSVALVQREATPGGVPWASLLVFPVVYHTSLQMGFVNWLLALPVLLAWLAALLRWHREGGAVAFAALVLGPVALFVAHAQAWLFAVGAVGLAGLALRSWRRTAAAAVALAPSVAMFAWWYAGHFGGEGAGTTRFEGAASGFGAEFPPLLVRLDQVASQIVGIYPGHQDEALLWAWFALAFGWATATRGERWTRARVAVALLSGAAALGYLGLPDRITQQWFISQRMLPLAVALALAALPTGWPGRAARPLVAGAALVPLGMIAVLTREYRAFGPSVAAAVGLLDRIPAGEKVLGLPFDDWSEHAEHRVYQHIPAYYLVRTTGVLGHSFFTLPSFPVRLRDPGPMPAEGHAAELDAWCGLLHGENADATWFLVRGQDKGTMLSLEPAVGLVARDGEWRLYHRTAPIDLDPGLAFRVGKRLSCAAP